jgi:small subunit ribosomal protein S16
MPTKIRLQRKGKKGQPFYHIVIADGRAPRDGKFIERIGIYNPLAKPAEIELNFDKALDWLQKGAQPTDTVRAIFSYKGILYKSHLLKGVKKGALTPESAEAKFLEWQEAKKAKISSAVKEQELTVKESKKKQLAYEVGVNEAKAQAVAKKIAKQQAAEAAEAAAAAEEPVAAVEETVAATEEAVVADVVETAPEAEAKTPEAPEDQPQAEEIKPE